MPFRPVEPVLLSYRTAAVFSHNGWFYNCENKSLIGSLTLTKECELPVHQNIIWDEPFARIYFSLSLSPLSRLSVNLTPIGAHQRSIE